MAVFWLYPFSYIHGNGSNKRNYIFAEDVARAFDKIIHNGVVGTLGDFLREVQMASNVVG